MNPVAPVTSAVLFDPGFTYLCLGGHGLARYCSQSRTQPLRCCDPHSQSTSSITGTLGRPDLSGPPEEDPKKHHPHSSLRD
jgi:hypothetical protein